MTPPFATLCRLAREQHQVSQAELARRLDISRQRVFGIEVDAEPMSEATVRAWAKALGVDPLAMLCEAADIHDGVARDEADEGEW